MRAAIVGPPDRRRELSSFLTHYADSICAETEIICADRISGLPNSFWQLAFIYADENSCDAYFDFLSANPDCDIVLWAEDDHLACSLLRYHPCGFLVLPADEEQFFRIMKKCRSWADALRSITVPGIGSGLRIRCVEIQYIESLGHSCVIHCRDNAFTVNCGLSSVQQQLGPGFLRCHRGFVVNLRCISHVEGKTVCLQNGEKLPISPTQTEAVGAEVRTYMSEFARLAQGSAAL